MSSRARNWCFTLNNPNGPPDFSALADCRYGIAQLERGESGTTHYQGYVELTKPVRLGHLRKWLDGAHFEPRKGSREQARDYCRKTDTQLEPPIEWGKWDLQPGRRTDILALKQSIDSGANLEQIWEAHPLEFLKYHNGIQLIQTVKTKPRDWKTRVTVLVGPTGTGKSKWVYDNFAVTDVYPKQRSNWWCGYQGHPVVLLDDFYGWLPFDEMLRLMDRYPMIVQTKGSQTQFLAKDLVITSNKQPWEWYNSEKVQTKMDAFYRRIDQWIFMPEQGTSFVFTSRLEFEECMYNWKNKIDL